MFVPPFSLAKTHRFSKVGFDGLFHRHAGIGFYKYNENSDILYLNLDFNGPVYAFSGSSCATAVSSAKSSSALAVVSGSSRKPMCPEFSSQTTRASG